MSQQFDPQTAVKVQEILTKMVAELLLNKPQEPIPHIVQHLQDLQGKGTPSLTKDEKTELNQLRDEVEKLRTKAKQIKKKAQRAESSGSEKKRGEDSSEDSEVDEEFIDEMNEPLSPIKNQQMVQQAQRARQSVSAEVFGKFHVKEAFKANVVKKDQDVKKRIEERLLQAFMFMALDDNELQVVIDAMDEKKVPAGEYVIKEGDAGDVLFIVESGELSCTKVIDGASKFLKKYNPGDVFGELALLYNAPRAASIQADSDSLLWMLDRNTFNHIVKEASQKKRAKYENFLATVPILENMDHYERSKMADAVKEKKVKNGETIIKQGEQGDIFYILVEGSAIATLNEKGSEPVMEYNSGDYFGELALLKGEPRAANVLASSDCKLIMLERKSFKRLLGPLDEILKRNIASYNNFMKQK